MALTLSTIIVCRGRSDQRRAPRLFEPDRRREILLQTAVFYQDSILIASNHRIQITNITYKKLVAAQCALKYQHSIYYVYTVYS